MKNDSAKGRPEIAVSLLVPYSLSATHGNSLRVKSMIEHNAEAVYRVFCYDLPWVGPKNASIPILLTFEAAYNRLLRRLPIADLLVCEKAPQSLVKAYSRHSAGCQVLQPENLWSTSIALKAKSVDTPILATFHDVYSDRMRELLTYFGARPSAMEGVVRRVIELERQLLPQMDACVFVSHEDLERYRQLEIDMQKAAVIPNGVDTEKYRPLPQENREIYRRRFGLSRKPTILFAGSDMYQNRQAVGVIGETLRRLGGSKYQLVVAGTISRFAEKHLGIGVDAKFLGYVENLVEVYAAVDVVFAPMVSGTGTKLKILEAMACAKPVLTTPKGVRGIEVDGACAVAEGLEELAAKLGELLANQELRRELGSKAREVALKYDWRRLMPKYAQLYREILGC